MSQMFSFISNGFQLLPATPRDMNVTWEREVTAQ
jgi:hypothetical protein